MRKTSIISKLRDMDGGNVISFTLTQKNYEALQEELKPHLKYGHVKTGPPTFRGKPINVGKTNMSVIRNVSNS
jgi:hypothetical protein